MIQRSFVLSALLCLIADGFSPSVSTFSSTNIRAMTTTTSTSTSIYMADSSSMAETWKKAATAAVLTLAIVTHPMPAFADGGTKEFKLPPIDFADKTRCTLNSSKIGQANAARDKLYDLRQCDLSGQNANGFDLSGVIMTKTNLSKATLKETQFSKAYLHDSNFDGADFSNGIIDRASFRGSSLVGAIFENAVLTGTSFEGANVENTDFSDSYIGAFDIKNLCKNPTLKGENPTTGADTFMSAGCFEK